MRIVLLMLFALAVAACAATDSNVPAPGEAPSPWPRLSEAAWSQVAAMDGLELDLADEAEQGRAVVLVFWLPSCASCIEEGPTVAAAAERLADELLIIGVVAGPDGDVDDERVRAAIERHGLSYPHVRDRAGALVKDLRVAGTPTIVGFDRNGRVAHRSSRVHDWDELLRKLR